MRASLRLHRRSVREVRAQRSCKKYNQRHSCIQYTIEHCPLFTMHDLISRLLTKRGITEASEVSAFLNPDYELHTHDSFLLAGMDVAVERLLQAIERGERVAIYADFDCDGIPGAALLS